MARDWSSLKSWGAGQADRWQSLWRNPVAERLAIDNYYWVSLGTPFPLSFLVPDHDFFRIQIEKRQWMQDVDLAEWLRPKSRQELVVIELFTRGYCHHDELRWLHNQTTATDQRQHQWETFEMLCDLPTSHCWNSVLRTNSSPSLVTIQHRKDRGPHPTIILRHHPSLHIQLAWSVCPSKDLGLVPRLHLWTAYIWRVASVYADVFSWTSTSTNATVQKSLSVEGASSKWRWTIRFSLWRSINTAINCSRAWIRLHVWSCLCASRILLKDLRLRSIHKRTLIYRRAKSLLGSWHASCMSSRWQ